jgi:hypothetical protein
MLQKDGRNFFLIQYPFSRLNIVDVSDQPEKLDYSLII